MKIKIKTDYGEVVASLNDTKTSEKIFSILPIVGRVNIWGEEIYFDILVDEELEEPSKQEMSVGDLAYWSDGKAFCIFFGPTPASKNGKPRAVSSVTFLGRILEVNEDVVKMLRKVRDGEKIVLEKA